MAIVKRCSLYLTPAWMGRPSPLALWLRLPVQGLLVWWAWWHTHE